MSRVPLSVTQKPVLPLKLPDLKIQVGKLDLAAKALSLDESGLTAGSVVLTLPDTLKHVNGSLTLTNVHLDPNGRFTSGAATTQTAVNFSLFGAQVKATDLTFGHDALNAASAAVAMPAVFHASGMLGISHLAVHRDGHVDGTISAVQFRLGDVQASACNAVFTRSGILIQQAHAMFPYLHGQFALNDFRYDGKNITLAHGHTELTLPTMPLGAASVEGSAALDLSVASGIIDYAFNGSGTVTLPNLGGFAAKIEIGSVNASHPVNLYHAQLTVKLKHPIPIGTTPLRLVSISGDVASSRTRPVTYTFGLTGNVETLDGGILMSGSANGSVASDGNIGMGMTGKFIRIINGKAGFCIRFTERQDEVCKGVLGTHADIATGTGAYFTLDGSATLRAAKQASATVNAYGHLWLDHGPRVSAEAQVSGTMPAGFLAWELPPCGFAANGNGLLGTYQHQNTSVTGVKATLNGQLDCPFFKASFARTVFIDLNGHVQLTNAQQFTSVSLSPIPPPTSTVPTPSPTVGASAPPPPSPPPAVTTRTGTFTIAPGETDTVFSLLWTEGAPQLILTDPRGQQYTEERRPDDYVIQGNTGAELPRPYQHALTLYLPNPYPGTWKVGVTNLTPQTHFRFLLNGNLSLPILVGASPTAGAKTPALVSEPGHTRVVVTDTLNNPANVSTVSLYYVPASVGVGPAGPRVPGTLIWNAVPFRNGVWTYDWDTQDVPAGEYHVYAVANNDVGPPIFGTSLQSISVHQPLPPGPPRVIGRVTEAHQFVLRWRPPLAGAALVAGYYLSWRTATSDWVRLDVGNTTAFVLNRAEPGDTYFIRVSAYDVQGREGPQVAL